MGAGLAKTSVCSWMLQCSRPQGGTSCPMCQLCVRRQPGLLTSSRRMSTNLHRACTSGVGRYSNTQHGCQPCCSSQTTLCLTHLQPQNVH